MKSLNTASQTKEPEPASTQKNRGAYRSLARGELPKRRSESSVQRLAEKAAERRLKIEHLDKTLKRREEKIKNLEESLELADQEIRYNKSEKEEFVKKIEALEEKNTELENESMFRKSEGDLLEKMQGGVNSQLAPAPQKKKHR